MLKYQYTARNVSTGERIKANVEAENEQEAAKLILKEGLVPIDIRSESDGALFGLTKGLQRVRGKDRVLFARQLSTLINAGLPLVQAMRNVSNQTSSKALKNVLNSLISQVEGGVQLSDAMRKHPKVFDQVFVNLVAAGETSGTLDTALERIANQQEKNADIASKVRGAMAYPVVIVVVMIAVVTFMLVKVLPQVQVLYAAFPGSSLPIETRVLLDASKFIIKDWWLVIIVVIVAIVGLNRYFQTKNGRLVLDTLKLKAPPMSLLMQKIYMANFARTASILVTAGVPLLQVLSVTSDSISNVLVQGSIEKAAEKVKGGRALSEALQGDPNFLPLVPNMLSIGEQSGSMEKMMQKVAEYYEKEVDNIISGISSIIEPVLMVLLGIVALIIVAAVLLPVYGLAASGNIQF